MLSTVNLTQRYGKRVLFDKINITLDAGKRYGLIGANGAGKSTTLAALINEITGIPDSFVLVLDDYHVIEAQPVDQVLTFLLEHLPQPGHQSGQIPVIRTRQRNQ